MHHPPELDVEEFGHTRKDNEFMNCEPVRAPSPKRSRQTTRKRTTWYQYYAGYSPAFVGHMLDEIGQSKQGVVLDPWNGVGTTTRVALDKGFPAIGFDINPVVVIVAKAGRLAAGISQSIDSLTAEIITEACLVKRDTIFHDPLETWFTPSTSFTLRSLERSIQRLLISRDAYLPISRLPSLDRVSDLAAFFYTALFRVIRGMLSSFSTSNPTWFKFSGIEHRIREDKKSLLAKFERSVKAMVPGLRLPNLQSVPISHIDLARSTQLPLQEKSVSAVITSPPYCTRIDYAVTTAPELALLGMAIDTDLKYLRDKMLGTSTISAHIPPQDARWGPKCNSFIEQVRAHQSKAATSYYLKTYLQYFGGLNKSLNEINRVLIPGGIAAIVVQDSNFKELHIDLPKIVSEMAGILGLININVIDYESKSSMRGVNTISRRYRESTRTVESVVILRKG